ncbi:predicted protein [Thalassiosira pseudonana CCMP1335]|uniref:AB hydrolase-1 domain-containing protein n=1 Tax=Thalassiosira pseudonana TaxID=35128 RepID=B8BWU3_THAPS|nr:predicted protein [Thalassiosira pseudonana CCMP1335]EED94093.1 predicted protein [Thalassiosira pseudonana CCMP1335]
MTTIRTTSAFPRTPPSPPRVAIYAITFASLVFTAIYFISSPSSTQVTTSGSPSEQTEKISVGSMISSHQENLNTLSSSTGDDPMKINEGSITYSNGKQLAYYHCGPPLDPDTTELLLLHGAAFTKEDWKRSGILDKLCELNNDEERGDLSVVALDLPVSADGMEFKSAFDSLVEEGILSGKALTVVTPSASGKAVVGLGEMMVSSSSSSMQDNELKQVVKAWIPVAPPAVLSADSSTLESFTKLQIPILAIHGDQDSMGKKVTQKLEQNANAKGVELEGKHPVYLDSPEEFVREVLQFMEEEGL